MAYKKKTYRKKKPTNRWAQKRSIARQPRAAIADSQIVRLVYGELVGINNVGGSSGSHVWSANSIFDPNVTGVGHQPYGADQWAAFYNHYTVIGSRIHITVMPRSTVPDQASYVVSLSLEDDAVVNNNIHHMIEKTGAVTGYAGSAGGNSACKLTKSFSAKKFFNLTDVKDAGGIKADFTANPAEGAYYHVSVTSADLSTTTFLATVMVRIEYICSLSERKNLPQS